MVGGRSLASISGHSVLPCRLMDGRAPDGGKLASEYGGNTAEGELGVSVGGRKGKWDGV